MRRNALGWSMRWGFDACLDYKDTSAPIRAQLTDTAPQGVDVYFDNTGGDILQAALFAMRMNGRVSCCGAVSMYDGKPLPGPFGVPGLLITKRLPHGRVHRLRLHAPRRRRGTRSFHVGA